MSAVERDDLVQVAELYGEIARALAAHQDLDATLDLIVNLAVNHLEGCEFAGISLVERRRIRSSAASHETPKVLDLIQDEVDEGPCLDAIREHEVFQTGDLRAEQRWPQFSERAHRETGVLSILSIRLFIEDDTLGALNLYSTELDSFDGTDVALASVFAAHAAVAMSSVRREEHLERKAQSRDVIGRAKGILMATSRVTDDVAFDMLRRASQRLNVKLVDVAEEVTRTGETFSAPGS